MRTPAGLFVGAAAFMLMAVAAVLTLSAPSDDSSGQVIRTDAPTKTKKQKTPVAQPVIKGQTAASTRPASATQPVPEWKPPKPLGSAEHVAERREMVRWQIARRGVKDNAVLKAMEAAPRHVFVPESLQRLAYADRALPIGQGQTISQPYIVALMTELLELDKNAKVLEIGTGSGYQAAVLGHLTPNVYTVEIIEPLAQQVKKRLKDQGYKHIQCRHADGYDGWREHAPFDAIIVTCAAGHLPPPLFKQLKPGGKIVIPIGGVYEIQRLVVLTKTLEGKRRTRTITSVRFVPMTGRVSRK